MSAIKKDQAHWIKMWREAHGVTRDALAARVRCLGGGCSAALIEFLEESQGFVTHPRIAARIAAVTGATARQWDSIVPRHYRGKWTPARVSARALREMEKLVAQERVRVDLVAPDRENAKPDARQRRRKCVVRIMSDGTELRRYESIRAAALGSHCSEAYVNNRCKHKARDGESEFRFYDSTFRFADEWDRMGPEARAAEMRRASVTHTKEGGRDAQE